jgi:hypothetical protein
MVERGDFGGVKNEDYRRPGSSIKEVNFGALPH